MKKLILATALVSLAGSSFAYETENATSYSGPRGGVISCTTSLSGTSAVALKQQVAQNQVAIAAFLQSDAEFAPVDMAEVIETARAALHEEVEKLSDREVLEAALK